MIPLVIVAIILVAISVYLLVAMMNAKRKEAEVSVRLESVDFALRESEEQRRQVGSDFAREVNEKNNLITRLSSALAKEEERVMTLTNQAKRDKEELEKLQESFRLEFKNLANEILEEKSTQFKKTNKESIDTLLTPFKESMTQFRERVENIYSDENKQRGALQAELKILHELNQKITQETTNLTNALKGSSKVQGDWGEMLLATILESSNLVHGIHYVTQENLKDKDGNNLRPDVILNLPENKNIVIDSKVSLTAFVNYTEEEDASKRGKYMQDHLQSVRNHVNDLGRKSYQELLNSPDFVIMFVPNEPAFMAALQNDRAIWADAYNKKVIISSPTNLFALLKIVDDLWRRDDQSKNAIEIAERGGMLYDKFVSFVESLERVGNSLKSTSDNYDKAMIQLTGRGSLIRQTEMLRELGVNAKKALPKNMVDASREDDEWDDLLEDELEEE